MLKKWCEQKVVTKLRKAISYRILVQSRRMFSGKVRDTEQALDVVAERMRIMLRNEIEQLRWQIEQIRQDALKNRARKGKDERRNW